MGWIDIQQRTFTAWCNESLKSRGMSIDDIRDDLRDGLLLINLLEILSEKKLPKYNKNPKIPPQKYENTLICMDFIKKEGIKTTNIGNTDITDGNLKIILGLIWTLILHYHISISGSGEGARNDLLEWVRSQIPEYNINNFNKDWNDGRALCALTNVIAQGTCPQHRDLDPTKGQENCEKGMDLAFDNLAIPKVLRPEDLANPKVDEQAVMTYISYFRNAQPVKRNWADQCRAYGPGLIEAVQNEDAPFIVETPPEVSDLKIIVEGPESKAEVKVTKREDSNDPAMYDVVYLPTEPGDYKVHVLVNGDHIPGSIFTVSVLEDFSLGGEGKIRVYFSTTSSTKKGRTDVKNLQNLLIEKEIHLRPDFEPWIPIDVMDQSDRNLIFRRAGTRNLPIVFIDDQYVGDYDTLVELQSEGKLDKFLHYRK